MILLFKKNLILLKKNLINLMTQNTKKIIFIVGPTAIGKTRISIELAKTFKTEIISCDSRQFYKELKIGSAPPGKKELSQAQHHFIHNLRKIIIFKRIYL